MNTELITLLNIKGSKNEIHIFINLFLTDKNLRAAGRTAWSPSLMAGDGKNGPVSYMVG